MNASTAFSYFIKYKGFNIEKRSSNKEGKGDEKGNKVGNAG